MEGLLRETCSKVAMKIETAEGVELLDVLNDFERTPDGSFTCQVFLRGTARYRGTGEAPRGSPRPIPLLKMLIEWSEHGSGKRLSMEARPHHLCSGEGSW
jgi:hypothetical protein